MESLDRQNGVKVSSRRKLKVFIGALVEYEYGIEAAIVFESQGNLTFAMPGEQDPERGTGCDNYP